MTEVTVEGLTPGQAGVLEPRPSQGGEGRSSPGGAGTHGQRSYLRVVGVGIVVSPGSVQREQHSRPPGPSTRTGPGQCPASREGPGALRAGEGAGQGLDRSEGPAMSQGLAGLNR